MEWRQSLHPLYEVSEYGHMKLLVGRSNRVAGTILKGREKRDGYIEYKLQTDGKAKGFPAHRLVLFAFVGPPPSDLHECAHWDGNPANNHVSNLRWATRSENAADRVRHGTHREGYKKFNADEVRDMRLMHEAGARYCDIQDRYPVSKGNLSAIINRQTWGHIT